MKKIIFLNIIILILCNLSKAQIPIWTIGTPKTIQKKEFNLSMFYFSKYGITKKLEIQTKPLEFALIPHLNIKKTWYYRKATHDKNWLKSRSLIIGTIHGINYPTLFMKLIKNRNFKNLINENAEIPNIFAFRNELLISTMLKNKTSCESSNYLLTLKIGTKFSIIKGLNTLNYFENSFLFRETSTYHERLLWYLGLGLDGHLYSNLNFSVDFNYYSVGLKTYYRSFEHNGLIYWYAGKKSKIRMALGYKASFSNFPFQKTGIFPMFDITYIFKRDKRNGSGLFEPGIYDSFDDRDKDEEL